MTSVKILGFDTSGPWCTAALLDGEACIATAHEDMRKGQAERLMPLLQELLSGQGLDWADLDAIGVGTGPGNFTGIRIAVSAARGLALGLDVPAVGVTLFDALAFGQSGPIYLTLDAPREQVYVQMRDGNDIGDAGLYQRDALPSAPAEAVVIGQSSKDIAALLNRASQPAHFAPASAIARVAKMQFEAGHQIGRPSPFYVRPADAAPSRDAPPKIIS